MSAKGQGNKFFFFKKKTFKHKLLSIYFGCIKIVQGNIWRAYFKSRPWQQFQFIIRDWRKGKSIFLPTSSHISNLLKYEWEDNHATPWNDSSGFLRSQNVWSDYLWETICWFSSYIYTLCCLLNILSNQVPRHHTDCDMFLRAVSGTGTPTRITCTERSSGRKRERSRENCWWPTPGQVGFVQNAMHIF